MNTPIVKHVRITPPLGYYTKKPDSILVIVLKIQTRDCNKNIDNLKLAFSEDIFMFHVLNLKLDDIYFECCENIYFKEALKFSLYGYNNKIEEWSDIPCLIIKDDSVTNIYPNISGENMSSKLQTALFDSNETDLFFLCKSRDLCHKYKDICCIDTSNKLKKTFYPNSCQAIMFRPSIRENLIKLLENSNESIVDILNFNISKGYLSAAVFVPNLINVDINLMTKDSDYLKLCECANPNPNNDYQNYDDKTYWWLIFFILFVILVSLIVSLQY